MGDFLLPGSVSGQQYKFTISGDSPTADEQAYMDAAVREQEKKFAAEYEAKYKYNPLPDQGLGIGNLMTGVKAGMAGTFLEAPAMGLASLLPDWAFDPTREFIREQAYKITPQPVIGAEDSWGYQLGQGIGSFAPAAIATVATGGAAAPYVAGMYMLGGAGQGAEDAAASGATYEQRAASAGLGTVIGATDILPIKFLNGLDSKAKTWAMRTVLNAFKEGGVEAAQEAAQQVAQNLVANSVVGYDPTRATGEGVAPSAAVGGGVGAIAGALLGAVVPGRSKTAPSQPEEQPPAEDTGVSPLPPGMRNPAMSPSPFAVPPAAPAAPVRPSVNPSVLANGLAPAPGAPAALMTGLAPPKPAGAPATVPTPPNQTTIMAVAQNPRLASALKAVQDAGKVTVPVIQKALGASPKTAQDLMNMLQAAGAVSPPTPGKARTQLVSRQDVDRFLAEVTGVPDAPVAPANKSASSTPNPAPQPEAPSGVEEVKAATEVTAPAPVKEAPAAPEVGAAPTTKPDIIEQAAAKRQKKRVSASAPPALDETTQTQIDATAPPQEPANDPPTAETQPAPDGGSPPSDGQGNEIPRGAPDVVRPPRRAKAPQDQGLGRNSPVAGAPAVAEGQQPAALSPAQMIAAQPSGTASYNPMTGMAPGTTTGAAGQNIPAGIPSEARPAPVAPSAETMPSAPAPTAAELASTPAGQIQALQDKITGHRADTQLVAMWAQRWASKPALIKFSRDAEMVNSTSAWKSFPDTLPAGDKVKVIALLKTPPIAGKSRGPAGHAYNYFSKTVRPIDALSMIADDVTAPYKEYHAPKNEQLWPGERDFYAGTGSEAAAGAVQWVKDNLSPETAKRLQGAVDKEAQMARKQQLYAGTGKGMHDHVAASRIRRDGAIMKMRQTNPLFTLQSELTTSLKAQLAAGDLFRAVKSLATNVRYNAEIRRIAGKLADITGGTQVVVLNRDASFGTPEFQMYVDAFGDPREPDGPETALGIYIGSGAEDSVARTDTLANNTIYMRSDQMTVHTLLHELAHAGTLNNISDVTNPYTRQLQTIYDAVLDKLPEDSYARENLAEFVAELYGNATFRRQLQDIQIQVRPAAGGPPVRISALDRIRQVIANWLRRLVGKPPIPPTTSALDMSMRMADAILSPSDVMTDAQFDYLLANYAEAPKLLNMAPSAAVPWTKDRAGDVVTFLNGNPTSEPVKRFVLGTIPLNWFADVARKYVPEVDALRRLVNEQNGYVDKMLQRVRPLMDDFSEFMRTNPDQYDVLNKMRFKATLEEVDPAAKRDKYLKDADKLAVYDDLRKQYDSIGPTGRALYSRVKNMNAYFYDQIRGVLKAQVDAAVEDETQRQTLYQQLLDKLTQNAMIDPYFSLSREGDYWLSYNAPGGGKPVYSATGAPQPASEQFVQTFPSDFARQQYKKKLQAEGSASEIQEFMRPSSAEVRARPPTQFLKGVLDTMEKHGVKSEASEDIMQLFLTFTPEHSFLKSFHKRKGVRGFIGDTSPLGTIGSAGDIANALSDKSLGLARQLAQMKYGAMIQGERDKARYRMEHIGDAGLGNGQDVTARTLWKEFDDRALFAQRPHVSQLSQALRGITFGWTLGANVSAAMNNLAQIPLVVTPFLGGRYGYGKAVGAMKDAYRLVANSGTHYEVDTFGENGMEKRAMRGSLKDADHAFSIANYFTTNDKGDLVLRDPSSIPPKALQMVRDLDALVEVAGNNGKLNRSITQEMLAAESNWLAMMNKWSGFMFHHSERLNQQTALVAAYNLELAKLRAEGGQNFDLTMDLRRAAAEKAIATNELVNGATAAAAAPRLAQGPVGSVVFLFKRFGLSQMHMLVRTMQTALKDVDPMERKIARRQLIGITGSAALLLGVSGIPMIKTLMWLWDMGKDDGDDDSATELQKFLGEPVYGGMLNYLSGAEIASRVSLNNLIFRENAIEKNQSAIYDLADSVGGPTLGLAQNFERGLGLIGQGEYYRGVEAMSPTAIKNALKAIRFGTDGAKTMRGDKIVEDLGPLSIVEQLIGYTPVQYSRTQEATAREKRKDKAIADERKGLYRKYYLAKTEGDYAGMQDVLADMHEFNARHPGQKITPDTLKLSMSGYTRRTGEMFNGVSYTPSYRDEALRSLSEYDPNRDIWGTFDE